MAFRSLLNIAGMLSTLSMALPWMRDDAGVAVGILTNAPVLTFVVATILLITCTEVWRLHAPSEAHARLRVSTASIAASAVTALVAIIAWVSAFTVWTVMPGLVAHAVALLLICIAFYDAVRHVRDVSIDSEAIVTMALTPIVAPVWQKLPTYED